ncbi:MAG: SH3 domain-containing protein [Treponema sp.]|nr:SH3 domain-containing protein [Treponema sp.]
MKRFGIFILLNLAIAGGAMAQTLVGRTMFVAVKNAELKSSTGFFAETLGILEYGEQVTVLKENGRWVEVRWAKRASLTGWMISSGLTSKRITAASENGRASASAHELALAGKGFSQEVERLYQRETALNYSGIDALESQSLTNEELYSFLVEGHLFMGDN